MKNLTLSTITFALFFISCKGDNDISSKDSCGFIDFKYYYETKDYLGELQNNYILIGVDTIYSDNQIRNFISSIKQFDQNYAYTIYTPERSKFKKIPLRFESSKSCEEITKIISGLEQNEIVAYAHYAMKTDDCRSPIWEQIGNLWNNISICQNYLS